MPTLGQAISTLKINGQTHIMPALADSSRKLNMEIQKELRIKKEYKAAINGTDFGTEWRIEKFEQSDIDTFTKEVSSKLDLPQYETYAPWNPIYKKSKTIIK